MQEVAGDERLLLHTESLLAAKRAALAEARRDPTARLSIWSAAGGIIALIDRGRVVVVPTRHRNPRRRRSRLHTRAWDRCVEKVARSGRARSAPAVCTQALGERRSILKKHRRKNPRRSMALYVLYAVKGAMRLKYVGGRKFARSGRAVLFASRAQAEETGRLLRHAYARALTGWRLIVGT